MKEYICEQCGCIFNELEADYYEEDPSPSGITGLPPGTELYMSCPDCGSEYFHESSTEEEWDEYED